MDFLTAIFNQGQSLFIAFVNSPFFWTLKLLLAIYATVLFADIIMLVFFRGTADIRATFRGVNIPMISPKKMRARWDKIKSRLTGDDIAQYKLAIIEGDGIIEKILKDMKFNGNNMTEILDNLYPDQIENIEDLKRAHLIRNQIIHDENFDVDRKTTEEILGIYETFLVENEFME
jgi:hypothetical protein